MLILISFLPAAFGKGKLVLSLNSASGNADAKNFISQADYSGQYVSLSIIQQNTLSGFMLPSTANPQVLGALTGDSSSFSQNQKEITEYEVQPGDTLSEIAENFGISLNTLLWANNLTSRSAIKVGQKLIISPVTGIIYHVKNGDTVSEIAQTYGAKANDIIAFNQLDPSGGIYLGDILVIPNGVMPTKSSDSSLSPPQIPIAPSYFICPITPPCYVTQGLHYYNAIDFSHGKCGDPILAVAGGVVQSIKYGWNGGGGNTIYIQHPNGVVTSYGHILKATVNVGDKVYQGETIALMGGDVAAQGLDAGIATGCHVHFAVHGGANPFAGYVRGQTVPTN